MNLDNPKALARAIADVWNQLPRTLRVVIITVGVCMLVFTLTGCKGATAQIAQTAQETQQDAGQIRAEVVTINASTQAIREDQEPANVESHLGQIEQSAKNIDGLASKVSVGAQKTSVAVTKVKDIVPWWAVALEYGAIALASVGVFVVLWQSGALGFLRGWLGVLSPKTRAEGKLAAEALQLVRASDSPGAINAVENFITAKRATSPEFDAAYRKAKDGGTK